MSKILQLSDETSLKQNGFNPRLVAATRIGEVGHGIPEVKMFFLDDEEKELLLMFLHDGKQLNLLLQRNTEFPSHNRKELQTLGMAFMFEDKPDQKPYQWAYYKDVTKDGHRFDLQTKHPITGAYTESPKRPGVGKLLLTAAIYYTDVDAAKDNGQFVVLLEIGDAGSEDGGLLSIYQGREIPGAEVSFL